MYSAELQLRSRSNRWFQNGLLKVQASALQRTVAAGFKRFSKRTETECLLCHIYLYFRLKLSVCCAISTCISVLNSVFAVPYLPVFPSETECLLCHIHLYFRLKLFAVLYLSVFPSETVFAVPCLPVFPSETVCCAISTCISVLN